MTELLRRVETAGRPLVVLLGNPAYYGRFGFEPSGPLGITYRPVGEDNPAFQVRRFAGYDATYRGDFTYCWESKPD
jgi:putative acetyltransferase